MQKLFYVTCRWLQEDQSRQSMRISEMIKEEMDEIGFNYESISGTQRQRQELYREREKLIRQKQRLQDQKRQIQQERQNNLKLIEEKQKLQRQREYIEDRLNRQKDQTQGLKEQNEQLQQKRKTMVQQYQRLQEERDKIIEERQVLYERMEKIEKLQRLQRMYQQELRRLREQAQVQGQTFQEEKTQQEDNNEMDLVSPTGNQPVTNVNSLQSLNSSLSTSHNPLETNNLPQQQRSFQPTSYPVPYSSGFSAVSSQPPRYTSPSSYTTWQSYPYSGNYVSSAITHQQSSNQKKQTQTQKQSKISFIKRDLNSQQENSNNQQNQ